MVPTSRRFFITPLFGIMGQTLDIVWGWGGGLMHPIGSLWREYNFLSQFFSPVSLLCLRPSRSKYKASTINCLFVFFSTLRPKIVSDFAWWCREWRPVWSGQAVQLAWLVKGCAVLLTPCMHLRAKTFPHHPPVFRQCRRNAATVWFIKIVIYNPRHQSYCVIWPTCDCGLFKI